MILKQTDYITSRTFEITETSLRCSESGLMNSMEVVVPFDSFGVNQFSKRSKVPFWVPWVVGILTMLLTGFIQNSMDWSQENGTLYIILAACAFISWRLIASLKRNEILIATGKGELIIWEDSPNKETVFHFLDELNSKVKKYYLKKYGSIDKELPIEPQLSNLMFLKDNEIITTEEFEELKNIAIGKTSSNNPIGFK